MLAPEFIVEKFPDTTPVAIYFRRDVQRSMPGILRAWHETDTETYVELETINSDSLYLPYQEIFLAEVHDGAIPDARRAFEIQRRGNAVNEKMNLANLEAAEQGREPPRIAQAHQGQMPPGMRRG